MRRVKKNMWTHHKRGIGEMYTVRVAFQHTPPDALVKKKWRRKITETAKKCEWDYEQVRIPPRTAYNPPKKVISNNVKWYVDALFCVVNILMPVTKKKLHAIEQRKFTSLLQKERDKETKIKKCLASIQCSKNCT